MQNIKTTGNKFLVEIKNDQGEYEPLGVLSFRDAVDVQFTTRHAVRMQKVCDIDEGDGELVGKQLFTRGELRKAIAELKGKLRPDMGNDTNIDLYDFRNGYSTSETRDLCENAWPTAGIVSIDTKSVVTSLAMIDGIITEGDLEVYFNDYENNQAVPMNHGILIKDGKIAKVY